MRDYLSLISEMLGEPVIRRGTDAVAWGQLEAVVQVELPVDLKEILDAYAPVQLNGHLILWHPATELFNMTQRVGREIAALSRVDWLDRGVDFRGGLPEIGGPDGLIPIAVTDRREIIFLAGAARRPGWHVVGLPEDGDRFYECHMSFAEWLYRYLIGEELIGPGSAAFYPGPLLIEDLPRSRGDQTVERRGPGRGM